jgi:hypothetical protein
VFGVWSVRRRLLRATDEANGADKDLESVSSVFICVRFFCYQRVAGMRAKMMVMSQKKPQLIRM